MSTEMREVKIPCSVGAGAFNSEYLITIKTADGPISGFIDVTKVETDGGHRGFVIGKVVKSEAEAIVVKLEGSFFTTTGIARFLHEDIESHKTEQARGTA